MKNKIKKVINIVFILIFTIIFIGGLITNKSQIKNAEFIPLLISCILFLLFWKLFYKVFDKFIKQLSKKQETIIFIIVSIVIISLMSIVGYNLRCTGEGWDLYVVIRTANSIANNWEWHNHDIIYYQAFITNRFATVLLAGVYKLFNLVNIKDTLIPGIVLNISMIYSSIVCLYFIIRKLFGNKISIFMLISTIFLTQLFLYVPIFYTDTLSMPFIMLALLLFIYYKEATSKKIKLLLTILITMSIFLGFQIKATAIFVGIAMIIDLFLNKGIKKNIIYILFSICLIFIFQTSYSYILNNSNIFPFELDNKDKRIPLEHYIMMGINIQEIELNEKQTWYGAWNGEDYLYTIFGEIKNEDWLLMDNIKISELTYEEKKTNSINRLNEKIHNLGPIEYIKYLYNKTIFIFADGTYYSPMKISLGTIDKNNIFYETFSYEGKNFDIYFYISEGIHMCILLFMILSCFLDIKHKEDKLLVFKIIILFIFIFFLFWEARSRYILNYSLIFYILTIPWLTNRKA